MGGGEPPFIFTMAKIIEVIETYEKKTTDPDIIRNVYQLWTKEGKLIFEDDPLII